MKKPNLFLSVLFCLCCSQLMAQSTGNGLNSLDKVVSGLQDYSANRPQEKIHIHFDKPFHNIGDTVWFKLYLVNANGNRLSGISKVAYIDIKMPSGKPHQMVLPIYGGMATAQLVLSDSLYTAGDYPLRAYTQWMRNAGEDYFFTHSLSISDGLQYKTHASANFSESEQGLTTELTYASSKGVLIAGQEVNYTLKQGDKKLFSGRVMTNLVGKAGVVFPIDKLPDSGTLLLETTSMLNAGSVLNNHFVVYRGRNKLSLMFFPEGGAMIAGMRSKVAFKAVGKDGMGVAVKGYIENDRGEQVAQFKSAHAGMGLVALLPQTGDTYTAVLTDTIYKGKRFVLPKALPQGFMLSASRTETDDVMVRISRSVGMETQTEVRLIVQSKGEVLLALRLPVKSASIIFTIDKEKLAVGINQLTLFSADNIPLAERLVFVRQKDNEITLNSDKPEYATRELVKLNFDNAKAGVGGYSIAVVKADRIILPEEKQLSIYSNLLLSSDLKGHIEDPNYYFTDTDAQKTTELDALLLTQGWRRFNWTEVLSEKAAIPKYKAEKGLQISGKVTTVMGGKPVPGAKIKLLAAKEMMFLDTIADAQGRFTFSDLQLAGTLALILRASGAKESNNVKIVLDEADELSPLDPTPVTFPLSQSVDTAMNAYLLQTSSLLEEMERTGKIIQGTTLKTVEIKTRKKAPEIKGSVYPFAAPEPNYTIEPDMLQNIASLENYLRGFKGVIVKGNEIWGRGPAYDERTGTRGSAYIEGKMTILLNGTKIDDLSGINPRSLTGVQIITGGIFAANMGTSLMMENGSTSYGIVFLTMQGIPNKFIKPNRPPGFLQHAMLGYTYAREFYAPNYLVQKDSPKSDFRSTLFWKPDIITSDDGKTEFSFYTSDEPGHYQITLEGVATNGQLCHKVKYFIVK